MYVEDLAEDIFDNGAIESHKDESHANQNSNNNRKGGSEGGKGIGKLLKGVKSWFKKS